MSIEKSSFEKLFLLSYLSFFLINVMDKKKNMKRRIFQIQFPFELLSVENRLNWVNVNRNFPRKSIDKNLQKIKFQNSEKREN
jgi:hypothetical protein